MITGDALLRRAEGAVATTTSDGDFVLLDDEYQYLRLNVTASRIWELLERPRSTDDLVAALVEEFGITSEVCRAGVLPVIEQFQESGVLTVGSS